MRMYNGAGVIFMGGKASRLGGVSKADIRIGSHTCLDRVKAVLTPNFDTVALSVAAPSDYELPTILDWPSETEDGGVIFSVLATLNWASDQGFDYAVTSPCDTPFLAQDYALRLRDEYDGEAPVVCSSRGQVHNLHALWPVAQLENLKTHVLEKGERRVGRIHAILGSTIVDFEDDPVDPFFNINTQLDLGQAQAYAKELGL